MSVPAKPKKFEYAIIEAIAVNHDVSALEQRLDVAGAAGYRLASCVASEGIIVWTLVRAVEADPETP